MSNPFPYQFLVNLAGEADGFSLPLYLKEVLKKVDIPDFQRLEDFLLNEIQNTSVQNQASFEYFLFIVNESLSYFFTLKDTEKFEQAITLAKHRFQAIRTAQIISFSFEAWEKFLGFKQVGFQRMVRKIPLETFEESIDKLDWTIFNGKFISDLSTTIAYVYILEEDDEQISRARLWLQKSILESDARTNLTNYFFQTQLLLKNQNGEVYAAVDRMRTALSESLTDFTDQEEKKAFEIAMLDLEGQWKVLEVQKLLREEDNVQQIKYSIHALREQIEIIKKKYDLPKFCENNIKLLLSELHFSHYQSVKEEKEHPFLAKEIFSLVEDVIQHADNIMDTGGVTNARLTRAHYATALRRPLTEKEIKEIIQFYKKSGYYPSYIQASKVYAELLLQNEQPSKAYDLILEILKIGQKRMEEGGFYLLYSGFKMATDIFLSEIKLPGVSWVVDVLQEFFNKIKDILDLICETPETIAKSYVETFRREFVRFEPVSHYHIRVYFSYQYYEVKLLRLGAMMSEDTLGIIIADRLLKELDSTNNPLNFIHGEWSDFKLVPNDVRNKTLNKCINISKGDLPNAAKHLDFSYRNLRSYITFKEVNRLGFFLDVQETENKQLELGIRYMFHDLYKQGTIFEVVFDMPKFLVKHANDGFYSQDLEKELDIKGTTAKKYIKIMMEVHLISQDKTTGRKHFYKLIKENVMKRLGEQQITMMSQASQ
ncbi:MAG: hypothetical protein AAF824_12940 [Bacteroidota bacterium]